MSKGLEALEKLRLELLEVSDYLDQKDVSYLGPIHRIEEELKRLEEIDNILNTGGGIWSTNGIVDKELKALKIIRKKRVNLTILLDIFAASLDEKTYNSMINSRRIQMATFPPYKLTQEEFDLLKEVLKDE